MPCWGSICYVSNMFKPGWIGNDLVESFESRITQHLIDMLVDRSNNLFWMSGRIFYKELECTTWQDGSVITFYRRRFKGHANIPIDFYICLGNVVHAENFERGIVKYSFEKRWCALDWKLSEYLGGIHLQKLRFLGTWHSELRRQKYKK